MYVQTGTQRIEVIVKGEGVGGVKGNRETEVGENSNTDGINESIQHHSRRRRIIITNATHAVAITKQVTNLAANYYIQGISYRHGDQALQDNVARKVEIAQDVASVVSSVGMGGVYGAWGGPIGAVLGATFGAISSVASIATKYGSREREYSVKEFKQNNEIEYRRARANINLTTGRLR